MNNLTSSQISVLTAARKTLQTKSWYKGVCMDNFPDDYACVTDFENSVLSVIFETYAAK